MNKKISFIGIILALLLLTINSAFAAMQEANTNPAAGNPGTTVAGSFTVQDTDSGADTDPVTGISFAMGTLNGVTDATKTIPGSAVSFNPSSISSLADGTPSGTPSSAIATSVAIPASQVAQTYQGTVTISGTEGGAPPISKTFTLSVTVNSLTALDVLTYDNTTALEIIGEEGETNLTNTFQIKNTGNQALSALTFDTAALDLKDSSNKVITLSFSDPGTINGGETKTVTVTANYGDNIDLDTYGGVVNVKSVATGTTVLDSFKLDLKVFPEICSDGIVKDGDKASRSTAFLQLNVKEPDNGDDFKPGDEIKVEVDVENDGDEDLDVAVEAILYNLDEDEEIVTLESDSQEIKDGSDETFEFDLEVPRDFDGDENDRYIVFLKATEDGNEDQNCNFESKNLDFSRDKDDLIVKKATLSTSIARPGDVVELIVDVENVGDNDQRDAYVRVSNSELGIDLKSNEFDMDKSGGSDDSLTRRFSINIPANAAEKDYTLDIAVYDDNDDAYDNGQAFAALTVKGEGTTTTTGTGKPASLNVASQTTEIDAGKGTANIHLLFTNNEAKDLTAIVDVKTIGDWADPITSQTVSLHPGDNNLYFNLKLKDVEEGTYSATVTVRAAAGSAFEAKTFSLNFDVKEKAAGLSGITGAFAGTNSTVFWIIGDVVLILIALLVIKAVFFGKK